MRHWVTFEVDFPEAEQGAVDGSAPPPGRPLAERIAAGLDAEGIQRLHGVDEYESYGWEFAVERDGAYVWCMLQRSDAWLLVTRSRVTWLARLRGQADAIAVAHGAVCEALDRAIRSQVAVYDVRWYTPAEFQAGAGGSDRPGA